MSKPAPSAVLLLITLATLGAVYSCGSARAEPRQLPPAVKAALEDRSVAERHGLAIGIDEFADDRFPDLRWAEDDARAVTEALTQEGGFDTATLLTARESTREGLLAGLDAFLDPLGPDDTALVYISSHGTVGWADGRARRYIVTADTDRDHIAATAIEVDEVLDRVDRSLPRWKVVVLATCFGGSGEGVRYTESPEAEGRRGPRLPDMGPRRATVVLSASYPGGPAWEDPGLGHEIYTYYLLEALGKHDDERVDLNDDGALSAFEAHGYAAARTVDHSSGRQFPSANLEAVGERDVILVGDASRPARRAVFWPWGQSRGDTTDGLWLDGEPLPRGAAARALEPGRHVLEIGDEDRRDRTRRLAFHVTRGQAVRASDLVARSQDQWLGVGIGARFVAGAGAFNDEIEAAGSELEDALVPPGYGALSLVFEQRIQPRRPLGAALAVRLDWWPGKTYDGPLSAPAHMAAAELAPAVERRGSRLSLAAGPVVGGIYLRSAGRDSATAAFYTGGSVRLRVRLAARLSMRVEAQLAGTHTALFSLDPQVLLLPAVSVGLGVEL